MMGLLPSVGKREHRVGGGGVAHEFSLIGFGIDSAIEVFAASVVIWQLRGGAQTRQQLALRLIGLTFFALASYVAFESIRDLITQDKAGESLIGIVLNVVALIVMVPVAVVQRRTGQALDNPLWWRSPPRPGSPTPYR